MGTGQPDDPEGGELLKIEGEIVDLVHKIQAIDDRPTTEEGKERRFQSRAHSEERKELANRANEKLRELEEKTSSYVLKRS